MTRNIDERVEVTCPIYDDAIKTELIDNFKIYWKGNVKVRLHSERLENRYRRLGDERFKAQEELYNYYRNKIETAGIKYSLNSILPGDITIKNISLVSPEFHSRYSALKREYIYKISFCKRSLGRNEFYRINYNLDYEKIDEFINFVKELTFFRSFCKNIEDKNNFSCRIYDLRYKYKKAKNELIFAITANRFLHSMVRSIIGCALEIGRGKLKLNYVQEKTKKGEKPGSVYLPSNALFLNKIYY